MRQIGHIANAAMAQQLSDVLLGHGIRNDARDDDGDWVMWVHDDARVLEAVAIMERFVADPKSKAFAQAAADGRAAAKEAARRDKAYGQRVRLAQRSMYGADGRGWVTLTMLGLSLLVAVITQVGTYPSRLHMLFLTEVAPQALLPEVQRGEVWRLFTPMFLHFGYIHLFFNMSMWWSFGQLVELRKGERFFLPFVLLASIASNLTEFGLHYVMAPGVPQGFGGMSGVLYAVFGYAWAKGRLDPLDQISVNDNTSTLLIGWLVLCMTGLMGPIANGAHVGGLVFGLAWAAIDVSWFRRNRGPV